MMFINLTPHDLNIVDAGGEIKVIERSEQIARVSQRDEKLMTIDGFDIYTTSYGTVEGLPERKEDTIYIVSRLVAAAVPDRNDLLVPGPLVRNDQGVVIGAKGFATV